MAKIFIVEDEPNLQLLYRVEIESMGHEVICAANGRVALKTLEQIKPDLIILDIQMAEGDGLEFITRMLDNRQSVPVIINSAFSHYKNDFMSWAAEAYIVKSSDFSELKGTIEKVLAKNNT